MSCRVCGKPKPCAGYIRVSTQDQAKKGYSLPEQREQAERKAAQLGYCPRCLVIYEDVHTGSEMERPAFEALRQAVRQGRHDTVICLCPDRLGRNTVGMLLAYEELKAYNVRVEYVQIAVDGDTPEGNLFLQISAVFSDYERRKIISRIRAGKERKLKAARRLPHRVRLFGYVFDKDTDLLQVQPQEAAVVRQIFQWAARGDGSGPALSAGEIAQRLDAMGVPRSDGGTGWYRSTILRMLRREVYYTGQLVTHRWADEGRTRQRPEEQRFWVPVEPLVDETTWRLANQRLQTRRHVRRRALVAYPLRGLLFCGHCGRRMYTKSSRPRGRLFRYYHCPGSTRTDSGRNRPCGGIWWNAEVLEDALWQVIAHLLERPEAPVWKAACDEAGPGARLEAERRALRDQLRRVEERLVRAARLALEEVLGEEGWRQVLQPLQEQKAYLQARLEALEAQGRVQGEGGPDAASGGPRPAAGELWQRYREVLRQGPPEVRQRALTTLLERVSCRADGTVVASGYLPGGEVTLALEERGRFRVVAAMEKRAIEKLQELMGGRHGADGMV